MDWLQLVCNAVVAGSVYLLLGIGFALTYNVCKFFNFAHGIIFTTGAYLAFTFHVWAGLPLFVTLVLAIAATTIVGCLAELVFYRPLRGRGASPLIFLLASLGIYVLLQNAISMVFGNDTKQLRSVEIHEGINVLGGRITGVQLVTILITIALMTAVALLLRKTKLGRAVRAVADDPQLASVSGIESNRTILWTFALSSAVAGVAGILVALDVNMTPTMGMNPLMLGVVAVIIGGARSISGIALAALLLAVTQHMTVWIFGSAWQDGVAFFVLLAFLMFRPHGFGRVQVRKATVK
jgi:branched-chain amino acid transport system permease protein